MDEINISYISVVVYTAIDIDSLCSLKMLTVLIDPKSEILQKRKHSVQSVPSDHLYGNGTKNIGFKMLPNGQDVHVH